MSSQNLICSLDVSCCGCLEERRSRMRRGVDVFLLRGWFGGRLLAVMRPPPTNRLDEAKW